MNEKRWVIFGICVSLFLMSMFYRVSGAIIAPDLARELKLNARELGLLGAAFFYAFALIQLPLGLVLDRVGPKITMIFLNGIGVIGAVIFGLANGLIGAVLGRALLGIGMAANFMGTLKLFANWFDLKKFATIAGLVASLGALGSIGATSPLALLVQEIGWRGSFFVLAGVNTFLITCFLIFVRDKPKNQIFSDQNPNHVHELTPALASVKRLFLSRNYWAISISAFFRYGAFASIQALWAGPFLMEYLGLSAVTAGNLLLLISFGFILGAPAGGIISDRILRSRKQSIILGLCISVVATFVLSRWQHSAFLPLLGTILFIFGFFYSFGVVIFAHIRDLMPKEMSGTAMTGINFFAIMGGGFFIHGLGGIIEHLESNLSRSGEAYQTAFLICSGAFLLSMILYFTTRDSFVSTKTAGTDGI